MSDTTKTQPRPVFRLTADQRSMAARHGATFCAECGRPMWIKTSICDECVRWATEILRPKPLHVPGETGTQARIRRGR